MFSFLSKVTEDRQSPLHIIRGQAILSVLVFSVIFILNLFAQEWLNITLASFITASLVVYFLMDFLIKNFYTGNSALSNLYTKIRTDRNKSFAHALLDFSLSVPTNLFLVWVMGILLPEYIFPIILVDFLLCIGSIFYIHFFYKEQ